MAKYVNTNQWQKDLFKRTEGYAGNVRKLYESNISEIINLVKGTELEDGKPFSFVDYGYEDQVNKILRKLYSSVYKEIQNDSTHEWQMADLNNDKLVKSVFGEKTISDNHYARYFGRNKEAMDAFLNRKNNGMNLSQRVWDYTKQHKSNLEDTIDLAIGEGTPANRLGAKITQYLKEPDRVYKRFRIRTGTDKNGMPTYGSILKRRTFDKETGLYKWINEPKSAYKPGTGVYRSSYRNAQRLARTETNIAYRSADYERWQQLDFVIGVEIRTSNNPNHVADICDDLAGVYPKNFKWTGWHSNCRCYQFAKLATQEQIADMAAALMDGNSTDGIAVQENNYPSSFQTWIKDNKDRYATAKENGTLPYFIKDNQKAVDKILNPLTPEQQHHKDLVDKYGEDAVNGLYSAFDKFKNHISGGDLQYQIKKLKFEEQWVMDKQKYPTYTEMAALLHQELIKVQEQYDIDQAVTAAKSVLSFKSKSKPLNTILNKLQSSIDNGSTAKEIQDLTNQATSKIKDIEKARLLKITKSGGNGSTIDLFATTDEKMELARLQDIYDKSFSSSKSQRSYDTYTSYNNLAEYKKQLALKYRSHQGALVKLDGETAEIQSKALDEYINSPANTSACSPVGGKYQDLCSESLKQKITDFSLKTGISEDEIGLVARYTSGSKWCNWYGYGVKDQYSGAVRDYGGLCQKYYPALNGVIEKMPRFEGITFSGIDMDIAQRTKFINQLKDCMNTGKPYVNTAFLSSTTDITTTDIFGSDIVYVINGKKGVNVIPVSAYPSEDEVIFRHHTKFKINKVYQDGATPKYGRKEGTWIIEMEEL